MKKVDDVVLKGKEIVLNRKVNCHNGKLLEKYLVIKKQLLFIVFKGKAFFH